MADRAVLGTYADLIATHIEQFAPDRRAPGGDRHRAAVGLVSATDGLIIDWLSDPKSGDQEQIVAMLLDIFAPG